MTVVLSDQKLNTVKTPYLKTNFKKKKLCSLNFRRLLRVAFTTGQFIHYFGCKSDWKLSSESQAKIYTQCVIIHNGAPRVCEARVRMGGAP